MPYFDGKATTVLLSRIALLLNQGCSNNKHHLKDEIMLMRSDQSTETIQYYFALVCKTLRK